MTALRGAQWAPFALPFMASSTEWNVLQDRLARGEEGAAETLYAYVRELCAARVHPAEGHEDLVQDLMQHAVRQLLDERKASQLLRIRDLRAFVSTMVANLQRRGYRERRRRPDLGPLPDLRPECLIDPKARQPDDRTQREDVVTAVRLGVGDLKKADRDILHLRWVEGLLPNEIAARMSEETGHIVPRATVDTRLRRAYRRLRESLADRGMFPPF